MSNQEAFDKVWQHFVVAKGKRSIHPTSGQCLYNDGNGNKCAVGCLIPDELYLERFEGKGPARVRELLSGVDTLVCKVELNLLRDMQSSHDNYELSNEHDPDFSIYMAEELKAMATQYKLVIPTHA